MVKSIELFAGCGGLALGMEMAGFKLQLISDFNKVCCETLKANKPKWNIVCDDINNLDFSCYKEDSIDLLTGGLPCQPYSTSGLRKGMEDPRGIVFFDYCRAITEISPKLFLIENVKGLLTHESGLTFQFMEDYLTKLGYTVKYKVLNAWHYGVAQTRERLIIIGIRNDVYESRKKSGIRFRFPGTLPEEKRKSVYDAIRSEKVVDDTGEGMTYSAMKQVILEQVPEGGCWIDLPEHIQREYLGNSFESGGGKRGIAKRLSWNKPCLTLTTSPSQKQTERCHPTETRPLTVYEYKLLQSFPNDYIITGSIVNKYKQLGNAVPPKMAKALGIAIKDYLEEESLSDLDD